MLTKAELGQIYYINIEIKMWQKELDKIQCKSLVGAQNITNMPRGSDIGDKVANIAVEIADIQTIINGKLLEIQLQRKKIIEYINGIDDSMLRQIVYLRNVSLMQWNQIASEIGGNTEDSVKKFYYRYLDKHN